MDGFQLSPGITPGLTDAFVLELPIALGVGYVLARGRGLEVAFSLNAIALGLMKLITDPADLLDLPISLAAFGGGAAVLLMSTRAGWREKAGRLSVRFAGAIVLLPGVAKAVLDFYDPADLLLSDAAIVTGLWLVLLGSPHARLLAQRWARESLL